MFHNLKKSNCLRDLYRVGSRDSLAIEKMMSAKIPFIISDIATHWPASKLWDLDYFEKISGQSIVHCVDLDDKNLTSYKAIDKISFYDFIQNLKLSLKRSPPQGLKKLYMVISRISAHLNGPQVQLPQLLKDLKLPGFMNLKRLWTINLWLGAGGTKSNLHFDPDNNLLVCIKGTKDLVLISPKKTKWLYRKNKKNENTLISNVNIFDGNLEKWPNIHNAQYFQTRIEEGEGLYIPSGWWHAVASSKGLNIALNFWCLSPRAALLNFTNPVCSIQWNVKNKWFSILFPSCISSFFSTSLDKFSLRNKS